MNRRINTPIIDVKKYGGMQVAIVNGKIIATGRNLEEVIRRARRKMPSRPLRDITVFSVPLSLPVIYHV